MPRSRSTSPTSTSARKRQPAGRARAVRKPPMPASNVTPLPAGAVTKAANGLRVRMYRIGFGDFFLLSVPTGSGTSHILIDCGVHAKDLGTMRAAVTQMAKDCSNRLALVIMTHRHADHISGFGSCADIFAQIEVERVWMPWFENPGNPKATAFQASLVAMAGQLGRQFQARLAAGPDPEAEQLLSMAENITGGLGVAGIAANQKALNVLHGGFKGSQPEHDYYKTGDVPTLPPDLVAAGLTAEILGPPIDDALIGQMTNKNQQYLAGATESSDQPERLKPFANAFRGKRDDYGDKAFAPYGYDRMMRMIEGSQPDVLAAQAQAADKTLNNQSLVILFSFGDKSLLFAGDAQWGNWENFLYGGAYGTPGHTQLTAKAQDILGRIDFYKVGHHGSANATPKDAVKAMRVGCVGMCSTQEHAYNEVPRAPLLDALRQRMNDQLARSDQVAAGKETPANPDAGPLPKAFSAPAQQLFIDYDF